MDKPSSTTIAGFTPYTVRNELALAIRKLKCLLHIAEGLPFCPLSADDRHELESALEMLENLDLDPQCWKQAEDRLRDMRYCG
jgi:hypothetical protein